MAMVPFASIDDHFFDDMFEEMNREAMRQHYDMRNAMMRLAPRDPIASLNSNMAQQMHRLRCPIVTKADGSKALELQLDLCNYKPEEINIKTTGREISVHAKHEEKTDHSSVYQEFSRQFTIPKGVNPETVESTLSKDGILTITGPADNALEGPRPVPIHHTK